MADIKFSCPQCDQHISADEAARGCVVTCPTCNREFTVPSTDLPPNNQWASPASPQAADPKILQAAPNLALRMLAATRQIFLGMLAAIVVAVVIIVAAALVFVRPQSSEETRYESDTPEPEKAKNTSVDAIDGYRSIKLGMASRELRDRLKIPSWQNERIEKEWKLRHIRVKQAVPNPIVWGNYEIREMLPEERKWAGMQISAIQLQFKRGILRSITLRPGERENLHIFRDAFEQKYGTPVSGDTWEGNDTKVRIYSSDSLIEITRKSIDDRLTGMDKDEEKRSADEELRRVDEMKKKLDTEKP